MTQKAFEYFRFFFSTDTSLFIRIVSFHLVFLFLWDMCRRNEGKKFESNWFCRAAHSNIVFDRKNT